MRRIIYLCCMALLFLPIHMMGQEYAPLTVSSGFNEDVIAEDSPAATFTSTAVDDTGNGANNVFMSIDYPGATVGLPANGLINSIATTTPGLSFQLAPYDDDNVLRINENGGEGTLVFANPQSALQIFVLATSGSDSSNFTGVITFTDDSTQAISSQMIPDWYQTGANPAAIQGIGRVSRGGGTPDNDSSNPKLFQVPIAIEAANQTKLIESISFTKTSSDSGFLNIFGVSAEFVPDCPKPVELDVTELGSESATLSWEGTTSLYDIEWGESGFTVDSGAGNQELGLTVSTYEITDLEPDTSYDFYVRQDCGVDGVSNWAGPYSFFTGYCVPATSGNYYFSSINTTGGLANILLNKTTKDANGYGDYTETHILTAYEGQEIEFNMTMNSSTHYFYIWIDSNNDLDFTDDETIVATTSYSGNYSGSYTIPALPVGNYRIRVGSSWSGVITPCGSANGEYQDFKLAIVEVPTCFPPTALTATDLTTTGATLSWESDGSLFDVEILEEGEEPTGVPTYEGVSNDFTTTIPLTGSTIYNYWVRQDCGDDDLSIWAGPYSFTTACVPVETLPYVESFDTYGTGSNAFPLCWERPVTHTYSSVIYPSIVSGASTSSPHSLRLMADPSTPTYAITPAFTEDINNLRVTFQLRKEGANSGTVDFGVMSDPNDLSTFELVETIDPSNTNFNEYVFYLNETELSGGNNYIAFKHNSNSGSWFIWIDDFVVDEIPTCFPPLNLEVDDITTDSAELTWEMPDMGNTPDDGYEIEIRTAGEPGETEGFVATMSATDLTATLADLDPGTAYTVYIKTLCTEDTDESVWESISFVTACELPDAPANITFTDITATATKINYEAPTTAPTGYVIFRSTSDVPPVLVDGTTYSTSQTTAIASLTDGDNTYFCVYNGANLEGNATSLTSNTEYYYYVFSRSAENDCFGAPWYSELSLTDSEVTAPATPTAAVVSNHTDTSATISWTASNVGGEVGAITYTLEVYTDSEYENPITGSPFEMGTDVSQDLTGLTASTQYFFRIKANNTYHDSGYLAGNFTTTQVPATLNYEQDFEGTHGWAFTNNDSHENNWYVGNAAGNPGSSLYISKDGGVSNEYNTSGARVVHAYRDIAVPAGTSDATISFDWKGEGEPGSSTTNWDYFRVWLAPASYLPSAGTSQISSGSGRIWVGGDFMGESDWTTYENTDVDLSSYAGQTMRLIFEWRNDGSDGSGEAAAIDNIEITLPDCSKPTDLTIDNLTQESADLVWASLGNIFDVKWGETGFDIENEGVLEEGFENGGTLSGLEADTEYEYYVRQDCGVDGVSTWAGPFAFYTGYCIPTGSANNSDEIRNFKLSNLDNSSAASEGTNGYSDYTATVDAAELQASFSYVASLTSGSGSGSHGAAIWIDYNNDLVFDEDEMVAFLPSSIYGSSTVSFPEFTVPVDTEPGIYRLRVQYRWDSSGADLDPCSTSTEYAEIEDYAVSILAAPTCFPPLNIEVGNITKNSAEATWQTPDLGNTPEDGYVVEIRTENEEDEEVVIDTIETTDLSATLSGLEASTTYTIYIKSLCTEDTDESYWSEGVTFTTLCEYPDIEWVTEDFNICDTGSISLEVDSEGTVNWYDAADATEPIFTGTTFETDELTETTSFWVETASEDVGEGSVGLEEPVGISTYMDTNTGLKFDVNEATTIESVTVYSATAGTINIKIVDGSGTEIFETGNVSVVAGATIPNIIPINYEIAVGDNYKMLIKSYSGASLVRDSSSSIGGYPYEGSDGAIDITGGIFLGDSSSYYYFYNWNYSSACKSPREEVVVTVTPIIDVIDAEITEVTGPTATLAIEADATEFDIEYGETGYTQGDDYISLVTAEASPYTIEGLTEGDEYDVYVRVTGTCGEWFGPITFTAVEPSDPQVITAEDITKVYGDEPFINGESDSGLALTYEVADETVATFVSGQLVIQGAGETEVTAKQAGNADYLPAEDVTFTLTVTKADLTVTADDQTKVYDGEVFEDWTVTYEGFVYDDTASDLSGELTYAGDAVTAVDGGEYDIEISGLLSDNYEITYETGTLTITKAELTGITFEDQTVTYDGEEKSIFITGDLPDGVTVTYTGNEQTEVGDYDVTAHIDGGTNYEDMELEAVMSIRGVLTDITLDDAEFTYDGTEKTIEVTGDLPDGVTVTYTGNVQTEAGEYEVVANIEGGEFYSDLELTATLTINKATITGITFEDDTFTYDCTEHSLTIDGDLPAGATVSYTGNNQLSLGEHTVTAHIDGGNNYENFELTAVMTIEELLPVITAQYACAQLVTADVEANLPLGWETRWYVSEDATDAVQTIESSGTYYVSSINGTCESSRIEVEVVVEDISIPTGETTQQFCDSATIEDIVVNHTTGANLNVYETATGGTALDTGTALYTGTFYIAEQIGDCESDRLAVQITVTQTPPSVGQQTVTICGFEVLANVEIGQQPDAELVWYANETTSQPMNTNSQIYAGTYYASQRIGICESARTAITFIVNEALPQPTASSQTFCGSAVVSDLVVTGAEGAMFRWFDSATSTTPLAGDAALSNGTYYVSQELNGCESNRKAISVQIVNTVAPQIANMSLCEGTTIGEVEIPATTGVTYKWYVSPTATTALPESTTLTNGVYYISSVYSGCESERVVVDIETAPVPDAPTGEAEQAFVYNISIDEITIADLVVNEEGVLWFAHADDAATLTNPLQSDMPLANNTTYYAVLVSDNGCVSEPFAVTVTVTLGNAKFDRAKLVYYPNPTQGMLTIQYTDTIESVEIYNTVGQLVGTQEFNNNQITVDMSGLSNGTYLLKLHIDGYQQLIKVVKN